ncbi:MAG TPA: DOMON-like domain-containing protein [Candidatus Binataceae bacterium]|nr:DOMON-like domain-containing protein [Candidatus Binataceae bacterium]
MTFRLDGDLARIRLPSPVAPRIGMELWRRTCFEAFVAAAGESAYHEFNFAPSCEWAAYAYRNYRDRSSISNATSQPYITIRSAPGSFELDAVVRLDFLRLTHPHAFLRVGLSAVIETTDGISYWALRHWGERPDFHDPRGFALLLEPPAPE